MDAATAAPVRRHMARGVACSLAGGVCWGFSGTCAQLLMDSYGVDALWITCARMVVAAVCFLLVTVLRDWRSLAAVLRDWRSMVQIAAFALFGILLTQVSYLVTIGYTSAGTGTAIEQVGLAFIMLYVCVRARRLPRAREVGGASVRAGRHVRVRHAGRSGKPRHFRPKAWRGGCSRRWRWPSTRCCPCGCWRNGARSP